MKFPVFDLHCDTALELLGKNLAEPKSLRKNNLHIDLERAGQLPGYAQCFACFTTPDMQKWFGKSPVEIFERELAIILYQIECNCDKIALAYTPEDIEHNLQKEIQSAVLTIEGPAGFDYDPALLEDMYKIGFRITTLGWNERNVLTGSHFTGGGLTDRGREYVKEAQRLGMLIDVSHISDQGFWDIMQITEAPVIASHSNSRCVHNVSRNLTDDMFRQICQTGGVMGFNCYHAFVGHTEDIEAATRHFIHFMEIDPSSKHLALGGDLDGCDRLIDGVRGIEDYPLVLQKLSDLGLSDKNLMDIAWNNPLGVMKRVVPDH